MEYYQNLESLAEFEAYAEHVLCGSEPGCNSCLNRLRVIAIATEVDLDYDGKDRTFIIRAYQDGVTRSSSGWSRADSLSGSLKTEIGLLSPQAATEVDHIRLEGYLIELGDDQKTSNMFTF